MEERANQKQNRYRRVDERLCLIAEECSARVREKDSNCYRKYVNRSESSTNPDNTTFRIRLTFPWRILLTSSRKFQM